MNEIIWIAAGVSIVLVLAFTFARRLRSTMDVHSPRPLPVTRNQPPPRKHRYYGVSIKAGVTTCEAADAIRNQRFLLDDAPKFPLPDCNREDCQCVAIPEDDRRAGNHRRAISFTAYGDYNPNAYFEKREKARDDRREADAVN